MIEIKDSILLKFLFVFEHGIPGIHNFLILFGIHNEIYIMKQLEFLSIYRETKL